MKVLKAIKDSTQAVKDFVKASDSKTAKPGEKRGGTGARMSFESLIAAVAEGTGFEGVAANLRKHHIEDLAAQLKKEMVVQGEKARKDAERRAKSRAWKPTVALEVYGKAAGRLGGGAAAFWQYLRGGAEGAAGGVADWWKYSERKRPEAAAGVRGTPAAAVRGGLDPMESRFLQRLPGTRIDDVARTTAKATERLVKEQQKATKADEKQAVSDEERNQLMRMVVEALKQDRGAKIARIPG